VATIALVSAVIVSRIRVCATPSSVFRRSLRLSPAVAEDKSRFRRRVVCSIIAPTAANSAPLSRNRVRVDTPHLGGNHPRPATDHGAGTAVIVPYGAGNATISPMPSGLLAVPSGS
jgi:hypothetical protein